MRNYVLGYGLVAGFAAAATSAAAQTSLPEIVVTAPSPIVQTTAASGVPAGEPAPRSPLPAIVGDTYAPVTVLTADEIARTTGATLGDTLFTTPGVTGNTFAPGASRPIIRGLDNARVRVQENGIGSMDVSTISEDHAVPFDPLVTDRLEVVRGPATLRFGPQAIGGVVAASNNRIPDPTTPLGVHGLFKGAWGSADNNREGAVSVDARGANAAMHADFFRRASDDYAIPGGGRQANTAVDAQGMSLGGTVYLPNGFIGVAISNYTSLYGIPGVEAAANNTRIDLNQTRLTSRGEFRTGGDVVDTVRFWLGGTVYKHDELAGANEIAATFRNREFEGRTEAQFVPINTGFGVLTTAVGIQGGLQKLATSGEAGSLLAPAETNRVAAYIFNELAVTPAFRLEGAARIGHVGVTGTAAQFPAGLLPDGSDVPEIARSRSFVPGSASVAAIRDLPFGLQATGSVSISQRPPEAQELFSKGPHEASGTFEIGNPDLGKEQATSFELGLRRTKGDFRFEASVFHTRYSGFIYKRLTGATCGDDFDSCIAGPGEELKQIAFDQKDARFTGAEVRAQLDVTRIAGGTFGVEGQYDIVRARFTDGTAVPRLPPQRLGGGAYWTDGAWFARAMLLHAFAQTAVAAEETPTAGYNLLNASVSYTHRFAPHEAFRDLTLGLAGTNLLDADIRNSTSFKKDEVLQPGRSVRLFATLRF